MIRPVCAFVALIAACIACGGSDDPGPQAAPVVENSNVPSQRAEATNASLSPSTTLTTATTPSPTVAPTEPSPELTIYRPEPIWEGDQVTAMIHPVNGVALDSSVTMRIVGLADGRFLQVDLTNAVVPAGAAFWLTEINGRPKLKTTARQGPTQGTRVDRAIFGDSFIVRFSATTADGRVVATTGDIQVVV